MNVLMFLLLSGIPFYFDVYAHRDKHPITIGSACRWAGLYVLAALTFALYLLIAQGPGQAALFITGYVIEKSLSVDNLIVFGSIFTYFGIKGALEHKVLTWGIAGAIILRMLFIGFGVFTFAIFGRLMEIVFGCFVLWSAVKLYLTEDSGGGPVDHHSRWYIRWTKKFLPVTGDEHDTFFIWNRKHKVPILTATPLLLCAIAIEFTDIAFAFDSVPVVIAVTKDPLLIYASIMFAVMGLRSLYFVLEAAKAYMEYLEKGILWVLAFVGIKLLVHGILDSDIAGPMGSLFAVLSIIGVSIGMSIVKKRQTA